MHVFNKKLNKNIVQEHAHYHQQKIPEQLYPATQYGAGKNDVPVQQVAGRKRYGKRHKKGGDVGADGTGRRKQDLLLKNEVVGNEIKENVEQRITATTGGISEGLDRHQFSEGRVKKIDYR